MPTLTKQYKNRVHVSSKVTPIQASLKKNEGYVYHILSNKRKNIGPNFKTHDLVRTADLKRMFSKGDTFNWSYILYKISETINDTKPSYHLDNLPDLCNEALLKKTILNNERK